MRVLLVAVAAAILIGCVTPHQRLAHPDGREATCEAAGFGLLSGTMAHNSFKRCVADAEMQGFRPTGPVQ